MFYAQTFVYEKLWYKHYVVQLKYYVPVLLKSTGLDHDSLVSVLWYDMMYP